MIDPKLLRQDLTELKAKLAKRGYELDMDFWQQMESQRKSLQVITEDLQAKRNAGAKQVGVLKKNGEDASELLAEMQAVSGDIKKAEEDLKALQDKINEAALQIPNIPADDVPEGESEEDNVEVRKWGTPKQFDFEIKDHTDVGEGLGQLDFAAAAKLTGSRFNVLTGQLAQLHRALIQFMLNTHTVKYGYTECYVPYIVNSDSLKGTGQLPKFEEDLFKLTNHTNNDGMGFYLIPTAEVPMTNLVRGERLEASKLPLKFTAHTPCFRSEAGSHGRDTRGLIRQHQFEKVEMVNIATAAQSDELLEQMTAQAEYILQQLELPYRVVKLCTGDMGFSALRTYDIEVWLPSQDTYREISSCSNCGDFQARRMGTRVKDGKKTELAHTLNGSGLAVGRTLLAIMENHQNADGSITIPEVLRPFMGGAETITASNLF
ncbi:serine--tRNA ligase [Psychrobacter sanguinis]|uniref:serine--tRNA ligase n=1 Tax=Psychrobacter sanguinis TaxID=861445 RepID=UPI001918B7B8|nr:serine--tRNA ligase [Psychrobacter sanguinis]MCC3307443.1 serine--tRNA ligase [Psychrobacter sanguinis]UEC24778.1 serine--tRNA ligase [Psychrobacter sanguinis]